MGLSKRQRRASTKAAQKLIRQAPVIGYVEGRSGANPVYMMTAVLGLFAMLSVMVMAATGTFLFPGLILLMGVQQLVSPSRGLAVCELGVVVLNRSFLTGKPTRGIALAEFPAVLPVQNQAGRIQMALGSELVWLAKKEYALLAQLVVHAHGPGAQQPMPSAPTYDPGLLGAGQGFVPPAYAAAQPFAPAQPYAATQLYAPDQPFGSGAAAPSTSAQPFGAAQAPYPPTRPLAPAQTPVPPSPPSPGIGPGASPFG